MNKLYAFYCRAYQTVFRAALPILPYREPIQLDGLSSIVPLLAEKRIASVLLVTDASVRSLGLTSGLEAALKAAGVACAVYDKTVPNPTIANIEEGRALYLTAHAQAIIAVGGGVSGAGEFLLQPVREKLKKLIFYKDMPYAEVKLATMGNDAGIVGAAMLGRL